MTAKTNSLSNLFRRSQRIHSALQSRWGLVLPMLLAVWSVFGISAYMNMKNYTPALFAGMAVIACAVSCMTLAMFRPRYWQALGGAFMLGALLYTVVV